ncbi:MAG: AmmeMemoRadiSam system protein B [Acidimicrobiia bacterium]
MAGRFYPADAAELSRVVEAAVAEARQHQPGDAPIPKALVAPHAGYIYSGPIAASAWARAVPLRGRVERVVLAGPAHWGTRGGVVTASAAAFATPLGPVRVDTDTRDRLVAAGRVKVDDRTQAHEHSLEVQLPFLQVTLGDVAVLPLLAMSGRSADVAVAGVLDEVWGGPETLVVVSTDLSHYRDQAAATALDRDTAAAVVDRRPEGIRSELACGAVVLRGLLMVAGRRGLEVELLDLRTSADTAGPPDRVVGYGAFALT